MEFPQGTVTLAFTDIEGSTVLWEKLGGAFQSHLNHHNEILRECIHANQGYEVKTEGDSFMVAFRRATDGVSFAADVQRRLAATTWPEQVGDLKVRIGVHTGEPIVQHDPQGRVDYFGPPVNRAARICSAGHGGQVLLSHATRGAASDGCAGLLIADLGEHRLKGLERAEHLWQALPTELEPQEFPPPRTQSVAHTNLSVGGDLFIGRQENQAQLRDSLLRPESQVVTLCGTAGCGKSRLAQRVGRELVGNFPGGVWYIDLQEARGAQGIADSVASVLGIAQSTNPVGVVGNALGLRERTLLILDSFEHLTEFANQTISRWAQPANAVWLVVSRSILDVTGERVVEIAPLAHPPAKLRKISLDDARDYDAVKLFEARAREAVPAFALDESNALDIARICGELEGIPLALELAARRVRMLKPRQIYKQLIGRTTRKTRFLVAQKDVPERQRTLFGAIDWSFRLLDEHERYALLQAAQFSGGFLLEAAEVVIELGEGAPPVFEVIQSLRDKSLLRTIDDGLELRFTTWVAIREFCERRLDHDADAAAHLALGRRHAKHFADYAESWDNRIRSADAVEASNRVVNDIENILQAFDWAKLHDAGLAFRVLKSACRALRMRGSSAMVVEKSRALLGTKVATRVRHELGLILVQSLLDCSESKESADVLSHVPSDVFAARVHALRGELLRTEGKPDAAATELLTAVEQLEAEGAFAELVDARCRLGVTLYAQGEFNKALEHFGAAADLAKNHEDLPGLASARARMGDALSELGKSSEALKAYDEAEGLFRDLSDARGTLQVTANRASLRRTMGQSKLALTDLREAEEIVRDMGDLRILAVIRGNMGNILMNLGDTDEALTCFEESAQLARAIGNRESLSNALGNRGNALHHKGDQAGALTAFREAEQIAREIGDRHGVSVHVGNRGMVHGAQDELEQAIACFEEAVAIAREIGSKGTAAGHLRNIGELLVEKGRLEEGANCYDEAEELSREIGDTQNAAIALLNRGDVELRRDRFETALDLCARARSELHETGFAIGEAVALGNMAEALLRLKRAGDAIPHLKSALDILQRAGARDSRYWFSNLVRMAEAQSALGNKEAAIKVAREADEAGRTLALGTVTNHGTGVRTKSEILRRMLNKE